MKIAQKKARLNKKSIGIIIALLAIAGAGAFYLFNAQHNSSSNETANNPRPTNTISYDPPTKQEEQATSTQKDQIIDTYTKGQSNDNPTTTSDIAVTISRANQSSAGLSIGTVIEGATSGTCNVTLSHAGQPTITKTFPIVYEATTGFCQAAIIPIGDITSGGDWQLSITATSGGKTSKAATQTVNIDKS